MNKIQSELTKVKEFRFKLYPKKFELTRLFYEKELGFLVTHEWNRDEDDRGVMFDTGSGVIELLSGEKDYRAIAGCGLSLEVSDVRALWEQLQGKENIVFALRDNDWGDTSFCITDPDGLKITFFTKT